jgi:hypothetical protein
MREGQFEVDLLNNNIVFEESNGFVLGSPGTEYSVRISKIAFFSVYINYTYSMNFTINKLGIFKNPVDNQFPFESGKIKIGLYIDGVDVQYWKRVDLNEVESDKVEVSFWGFKQNTSDLKAFVFSEPVNNSSSFNSAKHEDNSSLGQIKVVIFEAEGMQEIFSNTVHAGEAPSAHYLSSDKKFWQQASLTTRGGRNLQKESFHPIVKWKNTSSHPAKTLIINYHTPEMLKLKESIEINSSTSSSSASSHHQTGVIDLSKDDEDPSQPSKKLRSEESSNITKSADLNMNDSNCNSNNSDNSNNVTVNADAVDDIQIVPIVKDVPMLDISGDDDGKDYIWSSVKISKN